MSFYDRNEAGRLLADRLMSYRHDDTIVMAVPRGGVIVASEIARTLDVEMDIVLAKKIGAPYNKDYAIGALSESGCEVIDHEAVKDLQVESSHLERMRLRVSRELEARRSHLRRGYARVSTYGRTVIVVDDGVATGLTLKAAALTLRSDCPREMVLAVPVAAADSLMLLRPFFDVIICLETSEMFFSVGQFYDLFEPVSEETVTTLLREGFGPKALRG